MSALLLLALLGALACPLGAGAASMLYIRGGGDGHGIGMSQYGAYGYALHGKDYRWILRHYYRGTSLGHADPTQTGASPGRHRHAAFSGATEPAGKRLKPEPHLPSRRPMRTATLDRLQADGKKLGPFAAPLTATGPGPLTWPGAGSYRGALEFRPTAPAASRRSTWSGSRTTCAA